MLKNLVDKSLPSHFLLPIQRVYVRLQKSWVEFHHEASTIFQVFHQFQWVFLQAKFPSNWWGIEFPAISFCCPALPPLPICLGMSLWLVWRSASPAQELYCSSQHLTGDNWIKKCNKPPLSVFFSIIAVKNVWSPHLTLDDGKSMLVVLFPLLPLTWEESCKKKISAG